MTAGNIEIINFILGNRCNSNCSHCFSSSTPTSSAKLDESTAVKYAIEISENDSIKEVHFNGGEPILYLPTLIKVVEAVSTKQNKIIKVATGAGEFSSIEKTKKIFGELPSIDELWISLDSYHLENIPLENYRNLDQVARTTDIKLIYSISYKNMQELALTLTLIEENNFYYHKIIKQPVFAFGRGIQIKDLTNFTSDEIPEDYKCCETHIATVWPNGRVSNCSAYATRAGYITQHQDIKTFLEENMHDFFYIERSTFSLAEIAKARGLAGPFDVTSPCSTCKSILNQSEKSKAVTA